MDSNHQLPSSCERNSTFELYPPIVLQIMSGITHYLTLTALAVLGFYPTPVCNQRTLYDPVLKPPTALVPRVYLITMLFKLLLVVLVVVRTLSPID